jgi:hypothetical protein
MTRLVGYLYLFLAIVFWLPATCCAHSRSVGADLAENAFDRPTQVRAPAPSPSGGGIYPAYLDANVPTVPAPASSPSGGGIDRGDLEGNVRTPSPSGDGDRPTVTSSSSGSSSNSLDILVAVFFLIAIAWLVLALVYSVLVLIVVHLRARGQLDVYDENFGRFYLLGTRCYIPLGCVLRRYVIALTQERDGHGDPGPVRLMTREERRMAMELLLASDEENIHSHDNVSKKENTDEEVVLSNETCPEKIGHTDQSAEVKIEVERVADDASNEEPVCSICLDEYGML